MIRHATKKCIRYAQTYVHRPSCRSFYTSSVSLSSLTSINCKSVSFGSLELQNNTNSSPLSFSGMSCNSISRSNSSTTRYFSMEAAYQDNYYGNNYSDLIDSIENNEDDNRRYMTEEELLQSLSRDEIIDCLDSLGVNVSPNNKQKMKTLRKKLRNKLKKKDRSLIDVYHGYYDDMYESDSDLEDMCGDDIDDYKDYNDMTMNTLKEQLRMRNLKLGGRKAELIERLELYDAKVGNKIVDKDEGGEQELIEEGEIVTTGNEENHRISREYQLDRYSKNYTVAELKEQLAKNGLKVGGRKAELVERLVDHLKSEEVCQPPPPPPPPPPVNVSLVQTPTECVFDTANNYKLTPAQTLENEDRQHEALLSPVLQIPDEVNSLLGLLPPHLRNAKHFQNSSDLIEIVLDLGRRPTCWFAGGSREFLFDDVTTDEDVEIGGADNTTTDDGGGNTTATTSASSIDHYLVTQDDLNHVLGGLRFGEDNRAGIESSLHRISGIKNRDGDFVGATLRVGRYVPGNAILIADLLYNSNASILFVGPPGSAKTSILRDAARILSENHSVVIVDTSSEIGGAGDIPHECIGHSRRMQVKNIESQSKTMVECVQNHSPQVIIIDEVGRQAEVQAALTCKERGVRIMASAHGSLPGLVRNVELCELIGGVDVVTIGDRSAQKRAQTGQSGSKLKAERKGPPIFDVIVELKRGRLHEWQVVLHTASAVDSILSNGRYSAQIRTRSAEGKEAGIHVHNVTRSAEADLEEIAEEGRRSNQPSMMTKTYVDVFNPDDVDWQQYMASKKARKHLDTCPVCNKQCRGNKGMMSHALNGKCAWQLPEEVRQFFRQNKHN